MDEVRRFPRYADGIKHFPRLGTTGGGESEYGPFVASTGRQTFHRPDCVWASYLKPPRMLEFSSHEEAVNSGRKPCKTCRA